MQTEYTYDPWGKVLSVTGNETLGNLNPFRYRGYYYDTETSLYYLQSRYYDPQTGRFLNSDDVNYIGTTESEISYNPFAYCENNPVSGFDPTGTFGTPIQWIFAVLGGVAGWFFGDYVAKKFGYKSGWKYWAIRSGVVVGGAVLGWFAGAKLVKVAVKFLTTHPNVLPRVPKIALWLLGFNKGNNITASQVADYIVKATRIKSAKKTDLYHRAASYLSRRQLAKGKVFRIDGGRRILLQVKGELNGIKGVFEYIIDEAGYVCHQFFKPGGVINGKANYK